MTPTLLVQISDLHIVEEGQRCVGAIDTAGFLRRAVHQVNGLDPHPDAVVITGDLVNEGRPAQYDHLRDLLAPLRAPVFLLPGNHDTRATLRAAFPDHPELGVAPSTPVGTACAPGAGPAQAGDATGPGPTCDFAVRVGAVTLVGLDTSVAGRPGGDLSPAQFRWLEDRLGATAPEPVIVALHHPPFGVGIAHMDAMGLAQSAAVQLEAVLSRHRHVEAVICGHLHRSVQRRFGGTLALVAPSVAHAVAFDLRADGPAAWSLEPPGLVVHRWDGYALVSHVHAIGDYPARRF